MKQVTLLDGRVVDSASEDWRHECEARHILNMPRKRDRLDYLHGTFNPRYGKDEGGILQRRGPAAVKRLEQTILELHKRQGQAQFGLA
jgi:hypothetical protein